MFFITVLVFRYKSIANESFWLTLFKSKVSCCVTLMFLFFTYTHQVKNNYYCLPFQSLNSILSKNIINISRFNNVSIPSLFKCEIL